ncbi:hypothetical protein [Candidatus Protochlamydia phocaeensis]|uniref:hypothetical protein n=1 Tax=Candidatus Protochlamydia phocaeensis TaxID=1414722 RepID=UPI000838261D|nr:hypothetical protein [Candidatus Protochlamydia phocaeensis]
MAGLAEKIAKIEALIARTTSEGERQAAQLAKQRLLERQDQLPVEFKISHQNIWKKKLFMALCQKYGLAPYRYKGQKRTTSMVKTSPSLMETYLWPDYQKHVKLFEGLVEEVFAHLLAKIEEEEERKEETEPRLSIDKKEKIIHARSNDSLMSPRKL